MGKLPVIRDIKPEEKGEAVDVLTAAFYDYPAMRFFFGPEVVDYDRKLRMMIDFFSEARLQMDWPPLVLKVDDTPVAAALVNTPTATVFTPELRHLLNELKAAVGSAVMNNLLAYENTCERMEPEAPHYYLGMIGVLPGHQGHGYARQLLNHIHQVVDNDPIATGICLNTESPGNVPFYRHHGYEIIGEEDVGPLHTWCLFRPSKG